MKKMRVMMLTLATLAAFVGFGTSEARAAVGEKALGVNGGYATYNDGGYMNVFFQYEFANHFRLDPSLGYAFRNHGKSAVLFDVNVDFPFRVASCVSIYPFTGPTLQSWHFQGSDSSATRFGWNFGAGVDFRLTSNLKIGIQGRYSLMNDTSGGFFGLGIGYVF